MSALDDPEVVYVPARPAEHGDGIDLELRAATAGETIAFAFTSPLTLTRGCGRSQPYAAMSRRVLAAVLAGAGVRRVLVDARLERTLWTWRPGPDGPEKVAGDR